MKYRIASKKDLSYHAKKLGEAGGASTSKDKKIAAQKNGEKGGRPRNS